MGSAKKDFFSGHPPYIQKQKQDKTNMPLPQDMVRIVAPFVPPVGETQGVKYRSHAQQTGKMKLPAK